MIPLLWLIIGIILGIFIPFDIPPKYSSYVAIAILAALDSVFGGVYSSLKGTFKMKIFLSGFFGNALLAAGLAYMGDKLGIQLYLAAFFAFFYILFLNFAGIRRFLLNKDRKKDNIESENV